MKYNLSDIFKKAWKIVKNNGKSMSEALKEAWRAAKNTKKKLVNVNWELWFINKHPALCAAACNPTYTYEIVKETEKAVLFKLDSEERSPLKCDWFQWVPKSAMRNF